MRILFVTLTLVASTVPLVGCTGDDRGTAEATATATAPAADPAPTCTTPVEPPEGPPEVQGVANAGNSFWGLLFPRGGPELRAGRDEKIVWRMTGSGSFGIRATGPGGANLGPVWGPVEHGGSSWTRPGDEWGTGWNFPTAGCWTLRANRSGGATGSVVLRVG
ncbi:hypothetical protein ACN27G_25050 [Plantactinospora sp. WMMB334]|uniref:hypothetical protein n=1 Tax=Plantactinospora sp. WMMB334 TaxID=3404119 RepID=UPI003B94C7A6